jgi:cobalt ECF transporter T component CbiQ
MFLTPGDPIVTLGTATVHITAQGVATAVLLIARVETAVTLTTLLVLTTPWMQILKALRAFRVPQEIVMMLAMTHRYIFLLVQTAGQMFEARQSRTVGMLDRASQRRMTTRTAGVLLSKSVELSNDVFLAMQSRGFRGDAKVLTEFRMRSWDYVGLLAFLLVGVIAVWVGRS